MSGFPLLLLNPVNLDKIINKLEAKSYFRMQQTCRDVTECIRASPNISIHLDDIPCDLLYDANGLVSCDLYGRENGISLESLYGIRVHSLRARETAGPFKTLCDTLKKWKITCCDIVDLKKEWTGEQIVELLHLLKPSHVNLESVGSKLYLELIKVKSVKEAHVRVDLENVINTAATLIPRYSEIYIQLPNRMKLTSAQLLDVLPRLLQCIFSNPYDHLRIFRFLPDFEGDLTLEEVEKHFRGLDLTIEMAKEIEKTVFVLKQPLLACFVSLSISETVDVGMLAFFTTPVDILTIN